MRFIGGIVDGLITRSMMHCQNYLGNSIEKTLGHVLISDIFDLLVYDYAILVSVQQVI